MSIVCCLKRATDGQLDQLLATPRLIEPFLYGPDYDRPLERRRGCAERAFGCLLAPVVFFVGLLTVGSVRAAWAVAVGRESKPAKRGPRVTLPADWPEAKERDELDLDKTWEGIHYLLTGANQLGGDEPLCYLARGGEEIGEVDVGYGPARALKSNQVKAFTEALAGISEEEFRERFNAEEVAQAGIYPPRLGERGERDLDYLAEYFVQLKPFVAATAESGSGLGVWLC